MVEESVSDGRILIERSVARGSAVRILRANEMSQLWPLEVSHTVGEEHSGKTKGVDHGNKAATLLEPVWTCASQARSKV